MSVRRMFVLRCPECGAYKGGEDAHGVWGSTAKHFDGCEADFERTEVAEVAPNLTAARDRSEAAANEQIQVCANCEATVHHGSRCSVCGSTNLKMIPKTLRPLERND